MFFTLKFTKKSLAVICLVILGIISIIVLGSGGYHVVFSGKTTRKLPIYSVERQDKKIAISFDCAWGVDYTDKLLEIMEANDVKCTFFAVEFWAKKHPDYLRKISEHGHEIGTHSSTHPYMSKLSKDAIIKELTSSISAIESVINKKVTLFRAPYGDYNDSLIETASNLGLFTIQWDVDSLDWKDLAKEQITKRVVEKTSSGSIVLFHNQGKNTALALDGIIKTLKQKGYEFVSIGELIHKENFYVSSDGRQYKIS